ncbi:MAG TPA: ThuA domain-containing protein, partial [Candidatus Obscuribacterales bacterium]
LIVLHSAHYRKVFRRVLDCSGDLKGGWREDEQPEILRVCAPEHPIAAGVADFTLETEEMYGAPFAVPPAECLVFQSYFPAGGEFFPSGLAWSTGQGITPDFRSGPGGGVGQGQGKGRVFYFRPGHETCPSYQHPMVRRILLNAVYWAAHCELPAGS